MAPKNSKTSRKTSDSESNPAYAEKRARNNEAVRKSRDKAKKKADETMKRVKKLREDNKMLEGKIDEQKKTKKFLKELFIQQTTSSSRMEKPTKEQWDLINDEDSSDHESVSSIESDDDDDDDDNSNPGSPAYSTASSRR